MRTGVKGVICYSTPSYKFFEEGSTDSKQNKEHRNNVIITLELTGFEFIVLWGDNVQSSTNNLELMLLLFLFTATCLPIITIVKSCVEMMTW